MTYDAADIKAWLLETPKVNLKRTAGATRSYYVNKILRWPLSIQIRTHTNGTKRLSLAWEKDSL